MEQFPHQSARCIKETLPAEHIRATRFGLPDATALFDAQVLYMVIPATLPFRLPNLKDFDNDRAHLFLVDRFQLMTQGLLPFLPIVLFGVGKPLVGKFDAAIHAGGLGDVPRCHHAVDVIIDTHHIHGFPLWMIAAKRLPNLARARDFVMQRLKVNNGPQNQVLPPFRRAFNIHAVHIFPHNEKVVKTDGNRYLQSCKASLAKLEGHGIVCPNGQGEGGRSSLYESHVQQKVGSSPALLTYPKAWSRQWCGS
jgi:hypothetical protein